MRILRITAFILTVIGAINWGLVGFFGLDLVAGFLGDMSAISRTIYILIGLSGLYSLFSVYHYITEEI